MKPTKADQAWVLPAAPPPPADNKPNAARVALGKMLFFDPRLSRDGNMACATCHNPLLGWSDGLPTAKGFKSQVLGRASPTVVNTGYNKIQMWDGRKATLEEQAIGPMVADVEMNADLGAVFKWLNTNEGYRQAFAKAYPGESIDEKTFAKALASFERTVISRDSPFDRWLKGDPKAMTAQQVRGFRLFQDEKKGNCAVCHAAPNFTDDGFHNIGLASYGKPQPDMGRYLIRPVAVLKGAFKTPTLRDIELTAPYFHDGSVATLEGVVDYYAGGGAVSHDLSPNIRKLDLTAQEKADIVAFMRALTTNHGPVVLPKLPQ
jgi:cytochrome c peroxidase